MVFCLNTFSLQAYSESSSEKKIVEKNGDVLQLLIPIVALSLSFMYEPDDEESSNKNDLLNNYYSQNFSFNKKEFGDGTMQLAKSMVLSQVVTHSLKTLISKERPNGRCCDSFPSGHTSAAFTGAAFIQKRYGWSYGIPAYIAATYTGYSRVYSDKHDVEDVVAGAIIGIASSYYFTKKYNQSEKGFMVFPVFGKDPVGKTIGFRVEKRF